MKYSTSLVLGFIFSGATMIAQSAALKNVQVLGTSEATGLPNFIRFNAKESVKQNEFPAWALNTLQLKTPVSFQAYSTENDELGYTHTRYQQYFGIYPVEGTMLISHAMNYELVSMSGDYFSNFQEGYYPSISEQDALVLALKKVNARKYKWENASAEAALKQAGGMSNESYFPKGELVIIHKSNTNYDAANIRLSYKFNIYAEQPLCRANVFVDANTGEVIAEQNLIRTADAVGTGASLYSGTVAMTSDNNGGTYRLRETGRGLGVETYNAAASNADFSNTSANWNLAGKDKIAVDAHWGAEMVYDYFKNIHNRNSIDNAGFKLRSYVNYGNNYVNAYWDGSSMTYGEGDVSQGFTGMAALDICAHEITHGLIDNTAKLWSTGTKEADALNEGFADIIGSAVEAFARPSQHDWLLGADIMTSHAGLRDMSNPKKLGQPDCYQGTYWDQSGEPHTNDGPCIYWFYLLSQGGSGTNDKGSSFNVSGITMNKARMIAYRALTVYMSSASTYASTRTSCIQAASDLYGGCSAEVQATANAWHAVGVGAVYASAGLSTSFTANQTAICSLPAAVQFNNTSSNGSNYTWHFGDGNTSTAANPTHQYSTSGNYNVKLVAEGCGGTVKDSLLKTNYIAVSAPGSPSANGGTRCGPGTVTLTATGTGTIQWTNALGSVLGTGTSFTTPSISTTTTYYASNINQPAAINGAPATNSTLGGGGYLNYEHYLLFDANSDFTLQSVDVYTQGACTPVISLQDQNGLPVLTYTASIASAGKNTVNLNFHIDAGKNYRLVASGSSINLFRNNTGGYYPYNVGTLASITGTDVSSTNPGYYYYFYNWKVQADPCVSASVPVIADVQNCAGIEEAEHSLIQIYPNPASETITIKSDEDIKYVELYDITGKRVLDKVNNQSKLIEINISVLSTGVYFLKLQTSVGNSITKMVKE